MSFRKTVACVTIISVVLQPIVTAISCYQCVGGSQDRLCTHYSGASCSFGLFGCVKIATYSGGVDKMGNFINDERSVISMVRGCNLLPIGGVDACQQSTMPGIRIVTCYCYSDYCNSTTRLLATPFVVAVMLALLYMIK